MVLARAFEEWLKKRREKRDAEVRAEALAEERARWREWYNRRIAAEENNEPFDEPPPDSE